MRISKTGLMRNWTWTTLSAAIVFAVLFALDLQLKALSGVNSFDLQSFTLAAQYRAAFWAWSAPASAIRAGFNLGFDYLLMPLYAASFFYSGIISAEAFAPRPGRARRVILFVAMVPLAGAVCDAAENALEIASLLGTPSDGLAQMAWRLSTAKTMALVVGLVLLVGALAGRYNARRKVAEAKLRL
jgi:hypothetical protein